MFKVIMKKYIFGALFLGAVLILPAAPALADNVPASSSQQGMSVSDLIQLIELINSVSASPLTGSQIMTIIELFGGITPAPATTATSSAGAATATPVAPSSSS